MKLFIIPETSTIRIVLATLCGVLVAWAGVIVYYYVTEKPLTEIRELQHQVETETRKLQHRVEILETKARPMVEAKDSTVNYFINGERYEENDGE